MSGDHANEDEKRLDALIEIVDALHPEFRDLDATFKRRWRVYYIADFPDAPSREYLVTSFDREKEAKDFVAQHGGDIVDMDAHGPPLPSGGKTCDYPGCMEMGAAAPRPTDLRSQEIDRYAKPRGPSFVVACPKHRELVTTPDHAKRNDVSRR